MTTRRLLRVGAAATILFLVLLGVQGALRAGYDPVYHTGSELSLGGLGWIQILNFVQMGLALVGFAVALGRALHTPAAAALLAFAGLALIAAGVFVTDPVRGFPPGVRAPAQASWHGQVHDLTGPVMMLALFAACVVVLPRLRGPWRRYTLLTAVAGLGLTAATVGAWQSDAAYTGLVQRALILLYWTWIALLGLHLAGRRVTGASPTATPPPR